MTANSKAFIFLILLFSFISCNNHDNSSAYEELLSRQPYANLTDSIHKSSSDPDLYYRRGMLLYKNNNNPPALADLKKAWSISKKEQYAISISNILLGSKPDSVISFLQAALKELPQSISLHLNLIQAYADQQKIDEALSICDQVLQQHPDEAGVLMIKSDLLEQKNDTAGSIKALEQAYHLAPFNEDLCYNLAFKYAQSKNPKALILCDSLVRSDTINKKGEPYYFKGVYYSNTNDKTKALENFNKAIRYDYSFLDAYMDKGRILYEQKKYNDAAAVFQLALKVSATYADAYYWLGKCQEEMGNKEEARLNYQRAYGLDKSLTEAKEAADNLQQSMGNKQ
jgi:tetratricopeptide (TPR) repeat protein